LADRWIADGHQVIAVDNLITGRRANIAHLLENPMFTYIEQDICDPLEIDGRLDCVFHLASPASPLDYLAYPIETMLVTGAAILAMNGWPPHTSPRSSGCGIWSRWATTADMCRLPKSFESRWQHRPF
jgi:hypothetical protein